MFREVRDVSPAEALQLLTLTTQAVHPELVAKLADLMQGEDWAPLLTDEAIHVHQGRLRNGNHRLHAIVKLGRPVPQLVQTDGADDPRLHPHDEHAYDALGRQGRWIPEGSSEVG